MSDWLITIPAGIDSSTNTANRWKNTIATQGQQKVPLALVIPPISASGVANSLYPTVSIGTSRNPVCIQCCQFNYTLPSAFTLPTVPIQGLNYLPLVFYIRYRKGSTILRRSLSTITTQIFNGKLYPSRITAPLYNGEVILPQCSIEGFLVDAFNNPNNVDGFSFIDFPGFTINTSILQIPPINQYPGFIPVGINSNQGIITDIWQSLPTPFPINWDPNLIDISN